jgi:drug/metabolite transporter (DMT)-like permease
MAHSITGRWRVGLGLSLTTALLWGVLPMALKQLLRTLGPLTITWLRFLAALLILGAWLRLRKGLPDPALLRGRTVLLVVAAIVGLIGNYVTYLVSMERLTPAGAQTLIQLAPMLFLLGSVWLFKEPFGRWQWLGFIGFVVGLVLFFNQRIGLLAQQPRFVAGFFWILLSSVAWAGYALAQKELLKVYSSPAILWLIYLAASLVLLPLASLEPRLPLDVLGYVLLAFCCVNTVLAYGSFAEALVHWEASRVSAALAVTPLVTIFLSEWLAWLHPGSVQIEPLNGLSLAGAALVVAGSMVCALKRA